MSYRLTGRLIIAVVTTLLEEALLVTVVLWVLPELGIRLPLWALVAMALAWAATAVFLYRTGSRALRRRPVSGLVSLVGSRGKVVKQLAPGGVVRIGDELWEARALAGPIDAGEEVTVIGQRGLKLTVTRAPEAT
jgi:membrane-bound ClpP family serine protease